MNPLNRFSKLELRNNKLLANRLVVPPMASQTADIKGEATEETINHYKNLSEAKAGLTIVEYCFVHKSGRSEEHQLGIQSDKHIEGLARIASVIKSQGSLAGIQVSHSGGKSTTSLTSGVLMAPSAVIVPVKERMLETPKAMNIEEINLWKSSFVRAAERALKAGFDLVEIHSAHGYGLNQWLSPITNQRHDKYGKDKALLLLEIVAEIRQKFPELLLSVRLPGQDFLDSGLRTCDTILLAKKLETIGVDIIHVSSGIGGWRRPSDRNGEGYLVNEAALIQAEVAIPVIGVGGIVTGAYIDQGLKENWFSLAAVGRAILAGPSAWSLAQMHKIDPCSDNQYKMNKGRIKMFKNKKAAAITALNLVSLVGTGADALATIHSENKDMRKDELNVTSLKSIESSWLTIPVACKAAGFNAQPKPASIKNEKLSASVLTIYRSFNTQASLG